MPPRDRHASIFQSVVFRARPCVRASQGRPEKTILDPNPQKISISFFPPLKLDTYFPGFQGLRSSSDQQDVVETMRTSPNEPYIPRVLLCALHKHAVGLGWMLLCGRCAGKQCARASPNEPHIYHKCAVLCASQTCG